MIGSPSRTFRGVAIAEAVTWTLLLVGMFLKYVTETTELGVRIFGMAHGVVFIAYCVTAVIVAVDQRWSIGRTALALLAAIPPLVTVPFDRWVQRRGLIDSEWRLRSHPPRGALERPAAWLLRNPLPGLAAVVGAVVALTAVALVAGPPAG